MELNIETFPHFTRLIWHFIPALVMALTVLVRLANESRRLNRMAENFIN